MLQLEQALKTLIYRVGAISSARSKRSQTATDMVMSEDKDIPYEVMTNPTGSVEAGAHLYFAKEDNRLMISSAPGLRAWQSGQMLNLSPLQSESSCRAVLTRWADRSAVFPPLHTVKLV